MFCQNLSTSTSESTGGGARQVSGLARVWLNRRPLMQLLVLLTFRLGIIDCEPNFVGANRDNVHLKLASTFGLWWLPVTSTLGLTRTAPRPCVDGLGMRLTLTSLLYTY